MPPRSALPHRVPIAWVAALVLACSVGMAPGARAQESVFYQNLGYGSDAAFSPLTIVLNDAFDVLQLDGWDQRLGSHAYRTGWRTLRRSVRHPHRTISRSGYGAFIRSEVLPLSTRGSGGGQWVPNYQLHLIGGGTLYAMTREWYAAHGFDRAGAWALATAVVERAINESLENSAHDGYSGDAVADLLLFDPAGVLLFSSPRVRRFFGRRLNLRPWPLQPAIGLQERTLENAGSYFSIQWRLPPSDHWHVFYYFGMNNMVGGTYRWDGGLALSVGGGLHARRLVLVDAATNRKTAELTGTAGLFIDREGSLLASLVYSGVHDRRWSLNVYPGVLPGRILSPGVWLQVTREGVPIAGVALRWVPGLALSER